MNILFGSDEHITGLVSSDLDKEEPVVEIGPKKQLFCEGIEVTVDEEVEAQIIKKIKAGLKKEPISDSEFETDYRVVRQFIYGYHNGWRFIEYEFGKYSLNLREKYLENDKKFIFDNQEGFSMDSVYDDEFSAVVFELRYQGKIDKNIKFFPHY